MLQELTPVPAAVWPVETLAHHLRLSRGFSDDAELDPRLEACLRAGASAIEARTGKALIQRQFSMTLSKWGGSERTVFPVAPVLSVEAVKTVSRTGDETVWAPASYQVQADAHVPNLVATAGVLPALPPGATAVIEFTAGFAAAWNDLPADLQQAVLLLAGEFFGQNVEADGGLPRSVAALIDPYRTLRLRGAGA